MQATRAQRSGQIQSLVGYYIMSAEMRISSDLCDLYDALLEVQKTVRFKVLFFAQKFYLRTLAKNFSLRESSVFRPKVLFANFRTFEKFESSLIELLSEK